MIGRRRRIEAALQWIERSDDAMLLAPAQAEHMRRSTVKLTRGGPTPDQANRKDVDVLRYIRRYNGGAPR